MSVKLDKVVEEEEKEKKKQVSNRWWSNKNITRWLFETVIALQTPCVHVAYLGGRMMVQSRLFLYIY